MKTSLFIHTAVLAAFAIPAMAFAGPAPAPKFAAEKCFGVNAAAAVLAEAPAFDLAGALRDMAAEGLFIAVIPQLVAEEPGA
jgi:hypothetical protein